MTQRRSVFTLTTLDRVAYRLSRLSYGIASWRGFDARRLAAAASVAGRTAVVVSCRFPPSVGPGPHASSDWKRVRVFVADEVVGFDVSGPRWSRTCDVAPGIARLRVEHDGPPPSFETEITIEEGQTLLVEVLPSSQRLWFEPTVARLRIWSGDDDLDVEYEL